MFNIDRQFNDYENIEEHPKRSYYGAIAVISIVVVLFLVVILTANYTKKIQQQFFEERSKNLLNISSKVADMMNSMITDVWSCIDTVDYQINEKKILTESDIEDWMKGNHKSVCIKRNSRERDVLILFDENSTYYMATEHGFYSGKWGNLSLFTELNSKDSIVSTTLPNVSGTQNYIMLLRNIEDSGTTINGTVIKYVSICIDTNDF